MDTRIVVPCYNEAARLDLAAFAAFVDAQPATSLLFVDDGSRDATLRVLEEFAAQRPDRVEVLALARNAGKAEAVRQGLLRALERGAAFAGFWDADLATPLAAARSFADVLRQDATCRWVIGSRVRLLGRHIERRAGRHYAGRAFATAASLTLGLPVYDTQCGAKLFRADDTLRRCVAEPFISRWVFDVEMIARLRDAIGTEAIVDGAIREYPLREWRHVGGSKVNGRAFATAALDLARIRLRYPGVARRTRARDR